MSSNNKTSWKVAQKTLLLIDYRCENTVVLGCPLVAYQLQTQIRFPGVK